ncbi:hypothetical protein [Paraburkholderia aspalathi]|uniref:hypothetical protein n=1 Tax=Paraburkholderia aspalathi TaxID=1324617 RepID=UPI0011605234|nr:hypothetical protein [Paraburkholderia aspalathi]
MHAIFDRQAATLIHVFMLIYGASSSFDTGSVARVHHNGSSAFPIDVFRPAQQLLRFVSAFAGHDFIGVGVFSTGAADFCPWN